jgi:hypothetical protein
MGGMTRMFVCLLFAGAVLAGCASAAINADSACGDITITGTLEKVKGEPAETTGWAMLLDRGLIVNGREFSSVEVFTDKDLTPLVGKRIEATGSIANARKVESGQRPAFVPKDIAPKKKYLIF